MNVRPILKPLPGEHLLSVAPALAPEPETTWNRRLHFYGGRTLSDIALTTEQNERAGRLTLAGQRLSQGVLDGLEAGLERTIDDEGNAQFAIHIGVGTGLAASGEVITLATPLRSKLSALPIYAPAALLDGGALPQAGAAVARRLGPSLGQAIAQGIPLPRAAVLLLQPVTAQMVGRTDPNDPCEVDPSAAAFDDWQLVDGCRLLLFIWPNELIDLPEPGPAWRNRIAYAIFDRERRATSRSLWPWEELGVPVGLLALDEALNPAFVDRYSVVRSGGKARPRQRWIDGGSAPLWQARIQQFAEQMAEQIAEAVAVAADTAAPDQPDPSQLAENFRILPPVGLLPRQTLSLESRTDRFFPSNYQIDARPIPLEQLDLVIRESAPLAPLQLGEAAQIELLVPVPQIWFEPRLLLEESVSGEFAEVIAEFSERAPSRLAAESGAQLGFLFGLRLHGALLAIGFILRRWWMRLALVAVVLVGLAVLMQSTRGHYHYAAPIFTLVIVLVVQGLRYLRSWRVADRPVGLLLARMIPLVGLSSVVVLTSLWARQPVTPGTEWSLERTGIERSLAENDRRDLVVVRYRAEHDFHREWVYNGADLDGAKVIWARDLGVERNRPLLEYYQQRKVWLMLPDEQPPRLKIHRPIDGPD
ncbi:MAG: hypothetical protein HC802_20175 [Caldilineaceae bacterium]|nr:hypothetical protein [Caldilineaceae bacterium]